MACEGGGTGIWRARYRPTPHLSSGSEIVSLTFRGPLGTELLPKSFGTCKGIHMEDDGFRCPRIEVGVMIFRGKSILLGKRKEEDGRFLYAFPGGPLVQQYGFAEILLEQVLESAGIEIIGMQLQYIENNGYRVYLGFIANYSGGELVSGDPRRWEDWEWFDPERIPKDQLAHDAAQALQRSKNSISCIDTDNLDLAKRSGLMRLGS